MANSQNSNRKDELESSIRTAEKGSDIYGLVEKIAYKLSRDYPWESEDSNWFYAQGVLLHYSLNKIFLRHEATLPERIKDFLNFSAHMYRYSGSPFDNWMNAQNELAGLIINSHRISSISQLP